MLSTSKHNLYKILGSSFGLGYSPILPGSFGTMPGVLLHIIIVSLSSHMWLHLAGLIVFQIGVTLLHYKLTAWAVSHYGDPDPSQFVLDEIAGYLHTQIFYLLILMVGNFSIVYSTKDAILWGFIFFRILDMIKIPPAYQIDKKIHSATGIWLDDIVSGSYAAILLISLQYFNLL